MAQTRFAIVGAGNIGQVHAQAIAALPETRLTVVCSRDETRGAAVARQFGAEWTSDLQAAVTCPDVDIVCICTPSGTHAEIAEAAAAAGKHLLVEKPLDVTLPRVDRIIAAARQAGVTLGAIFPYRFRRGVAAAKRAVETGRLGQISLTTATIPWYRPQAYYDQGGWRGTWALDGGGALMNQGIHAIDLLLWLRGDVTLVAGQTVTLGHRLEAEDTAAGLLTFADGGLGTIVAGTGCWPGEPARVALYGDRGTVVLEEGRIVTWQLVDAPTSEEASMLALEEAGGSGSRDPKGITIDGHRAQIADFLAAVREHREPAVTGAEGRKAVELVRAIYISATSRTPVSLPLSETTETPSVRIGETGIGTRE